MSFFEKQIAGSVVLSPKEEQLSPRQLDYGSRNVPRTSLRLRANDGLVWAVTFNGEMTGQASQGDYLVCRGYSRGARGFVATQIWLRGTLNAAGDLEGLAEPLLIADKKVCAIASSVFGTTSPEVAALRRFRDRALAPSRVGRGFIACYGWCSPWLAVQVFDRSAWLRRSTQTALRFLIRHL